MKKSQLKLFLKKIITEARLLENIQDPTKEEMFNYLQKMYGREEGFRDDAEVAIYWFANFYHGGQSSNLYSTLSTSRFRPGPNSKGPEPHSSEEMMYEDLVVKFAPGSEEANEFERKHASLNEGGLRFNRESNQKIYKDRQGGQDVYWIDNKDTGGKTQINPEKINRYISQGYRIIDLTSLNEGTVSPKNQAIIEKWITELKDNRKVAQRMIDSVIRQILHGMTSSDLPDTSTFANGLDEIEQLLDSGDFAGALRTASETAREMIQEEGGGDLFEGIEQEISLNDNRWRGGVPSIGQRVLVKTFKGPNRIGEQIILMLMYEGGREWSSVPYTGKRADQWRGKITHWMPLPTDTSDLKREGDEADAEIDRWSGSDDELNSYEPAKSSRTKQKNQTFFSQKSHKPKRLTVQDLDWDAIKKNINKGTLKETQVPSDDDVDFVEYVSQRSGEEPFTLRTPNGQEKFEYVNAKYPNGKIDIGVYAFRGDVVYGYKYFRKLHGLPQ